MAAALQAIIDRTRESGATVTYLPAGVRQAVEDLRAAHWPLRRWARRYGGYHGESAA